MKRPITRSCMLVVLEKHIVRRTSRFIRVRRLMCLLSIVCVCCLPTVCCSGITTGQKLGQNHRFQTWPDGLTDVVVPQRLVAKKGVKWGVEAVLTLNRLLEWSDVSGVEAAFFANVFLPRRELLSGRQAGRRSQGLQGWRVLPCSPQQRALTGESCGTTR